MADNDMFVNGATLNGDGVIGVDLKDGKGTRKGQLKFVIMGVVDVNNVADLIFVVNAAIIGIDKTTINESLEMTGEGKNVGDDRNVQKHVALEDESTEE
ncbi:hypothetical protein ACA910_014704 [Epithemia clementina (nom. ined.)]